MALKDHLSAKTADVPYYLNIHPQDVILFEFKKQQEFFELDDEETLVITHSSDSKIYVSLKWDQWLLQADADFIINFWNAVNRANGMANTFYWTHPIEGNTYVARFITDISNMLSSINTISTITLKLEGYLA